MGCGIHHGEDGEDGRRVGGEGEWVMDDGMDGWVNQLLGVET